jgi:hypothetical protein
MPAQKPDEESEARYVDAWRERVIKETTQPEIAVSIPT